MKLIKLSKIRKLPNGKFRVLSSKGKNMGTYDTKEEANDRLRAIEFFKRKASLNHFYKLLKQAETNTYSETLRFLRQENPDKVKDFMEIFKEYFQQALNQNLKEPEIWSLVQTKTKFPEIF